MSRWNFAAGSNSESPTVPGARGKEHQKNSSFVDECRRESSSVKGIFVGEGETERYASPLQIAD